MAVSISEAGSGTTVALIVNEFTVAEATQVAPPSDVKRLPLSVATPVGVGLPGVTLEDTLKSAANIDAGWIGFPVVERLRKATGRPVAWASLGCRRSPLPSRMHSSR